MKFVSAQCKACPFRASSVPGWLGEYSGGGAVFKAIWHGEAFFCHTSGIDYEDLAWIEKAMQPDNGKLCVGGLVFANQIHAPKSPYLPIQIGREKVRLLDGIECMKAQEFIDHHPDWQARGDCAQ